MKITEIAYTGYPVTDMPRARRFYEGVLQLKTGDIWEHEGKAWVEYDIGGGTLALSNMVPEWKPSASGPGIALEVEDFPAAVAAVRAAGATFVQEAIESPVCQMAVVLDPDGNSLTLHKRRSA